MDTWKNNFNIKEEFEMFLRNLFQDYNYLKIGYFHNSDGTLQVNDKGYATSISLFIKYRGRYIPLIDIAEIPYNKTLNVDNSDYGKIQVGLRTHVNQTVLSDFNFCEYFDNPDDARDYVLKYKKNIEDKIIKVINN